MPKIIYPCSCLYLQLEKMVLEITSQSPVVQPSVCCVIMLSIASTKAILYVGEIGASYLST